MTRRLVQGDPRSEYIRRLHWAYTRDRLNIFVGAGVSQESGFPGWEPFNKTLIRQYLMSDIGDSTPAGMLASTNIESTADQLYGVLGRDAAADFVYRATKGRFGRLLAGVLYDERTIEDLPLKSTHYQIASLSDRSLLFTINFDPLLELALARRFPGKPWTSFRSPLPDGRSSHRKRTIQHLHGWIDPDGKMSRRLVLTESDYLELTQDRAASANKLLEKMLGSGKTTLIIGMSLADPNFRRVLYFLNKQRVSSRERTYVVTRRDKPAIDHYAQVHWVRRGLRLLFVEHYDEVPGLLRDIRCGETAPGQLPRWVKTAVSWRQQHLPDLSIFTDPWQKIAHQSLSAMTEEIRSLFAVPGQEQLNSALFVPFWEHDRNVRLRIVAGSRNFVGGNGALIRAKHRVLSIRKNKEQGIAGVCYSTGTTRAVAYGEGQVDINFTAEMSSKWTSDKGYRDWRSIVAVPVIDTEYWVPVAVITLTSNMPDPFWTHFGAKRNLLEPELYAVMRRTAHFCLVDFASVQ
jgi:hypothetical protein